MASIPPTSRIPLNPVSAIGRLPTGAKLLLIISGALLPLALIALFATLQLPRTADQEARAQLRVAAAESARSIAIELIGDTTALRTALTALEQDAGNAPACARVRGVFVQQASADVRFAVRDRQGRVLCGEKLPNTLELHPQRNGDPVAARLVPGAGIVLAIGSDSGRTEAAVFFPTAFLARVARPSGFPPPYAAALTLGDDRLDIATLPYRNTFERRETLTTDMGLSGLALEMSVRSAPITSSLVLAMLLPIIMWAAAAALAFLVVDRLLIRPLRQLRGSVADYSAGDIIDPGIIRAMPAQEIRELGDTFRAISRTVALHEADLAAGLIRQTKLTREVHHRVKNNLQVIASLINFHARSAKGEEAVNAYSSIQRRVDALAVVHRNHHAEVEDSPGLPLRGILGELAQSIRASAPAAAANLSITLDVAPFLVNQDTATALAFLVTEVIELGMACDPAAKLRVSAREGDGADRAIIRVSSPVLTGPVHDALVEQRYGRVMQGLARQLRTTLVYDAQLGAYEVVAIVRGRE